MQNVIPALRITDYSKSKMYYVDGLGFKIDWEHRFEPHFPVFMQITRDDFTIYLTEHTGDCQVGGLVHFVVHNIDEWYSEFKSKHIVNEPPNEMVEGIRVMNVVDPDGNQLRFMKYKKS
ncbi:glyoxalase superfamily protein [Halalkalibacter lacteus]|uniref:glyoxalase superfamily protein n=1 Tax=Halalkalibacter lacteus TaxID=3090663 RepID=UPI002FCBD299